MTGDITPVQIVDCARRWIGTPYRHQASKCGVGADCLGLIRGVYRDLYAQEPETPLAYTPDWAEVPGLDGTRTETMAEAARTHLVELDKAEAEPGDVLLFRMTPGAVAKHAAVKSFEGRMIHACSGRAVAEVHMGTWWPRHLAFAFRFPGELD
ncbi:NlpC/P60 family protein [Parvibaculaceae bacterium PLY_AMNH_Bact1]|nr:NlpC/P60 family protein [Parvibaculaceae bacterium PLY_AMNH_Bact1]